MDYLPVYSVTLFAARVLIVFISCSVDRLDDRFLYTVHQNRVIIVRFLMYTICMTAREAPPLSYCACTQSIAREWCIFTQEFILCACLCTGPLGMHGREYKMHTYDSSHSEMIKLNWIGLTLSRHAHHWNTIPKWMRLVITWINTSENINNIRRSNEYKKYVQYNIIIKFYLSSFTDFYNNDRS